MQKKFTHETDQQHETTTVCRVATPVEIPLTQGQIALVSAEDYPALSKHRWHAIQTKAGFYAARSEGSKPNVLRIYMHREVMGVSSQRMPWIDHIDGNGLNNCRENLRCVSPSANAINSARRRRGEVTGIWKQGSGYCARIRVNNFALYLGFHKTEEEAKDAYQRAAAVYHAPAMAGYGS